MPTVFTHAAVAIAANSLCRLKSGALVWQPWPLSVQSFRISISSGSSSDSPMGMFAHRGFFHSPFFNLVIASRLWGFFFGIWKASRRNGFGIFSISFLVGASHGLLDALTNGGSGVAFLAPFDSTRFFLPWTPIPVSPIRIRSFLSRWGWEVMKSEFLWIWVPFFSAALLARMARALSAKEFAKG